MNKNLKKKKNNNNNKKREKKTSKKTPATPKNTVNENCIIFKWETILFTTASLPSTEWVLQSGSCEFIKP